MLKQLLLWFGAALLGGIVMLVVGSYVRDGHLPWLAAPTVGAPDASPPPPPGVTVWQRGDTVPADFSLPGLDGKPLHLSQFRGKRVLLNFWATWCAPCREEMPALAAAQARYGKNQVQIIGVAMDQAAAVRAYLRKTPVNYPIALGLEGEDDVTMLFGNTVGALPYSVLIDADGRIEGTRLGKLDERQLRWWLE